MKLLGLRFEVINPQGVVALFKTDPDHHQF